MKLRSLLVCCTLIFSGVALAKEAAPMAADVAIEKRMVAISEELRCLVCQNESLSGSHAELAQDLRREIRKMIGEGKTDQEILDFMVARYGDFVLYKPALTSKTAVLWFGPLALLVGGLVVIGVIVGRRRRTEQVEGSDTLSAEERKRLDTLLDKTKDD